MVCEEADLFRAPDRVCDGEGGREGEREREKGGGGERETRDAFGDFCLQTKAMS
jgi:hypothetical protein